MKLHHVPIFLSIAIALPLSLAALIPRFAFANPPTTAAPAPARGIPAAAAAPALPQPRPGLWHEASTTADGVTVTKIRDTTGGDYNVCYVASRQEEISPYRLDTAPAMLAIACVPERRP